MAKARSGSRPNCKKRSRGRGSTACCPCPCLLSLPLPLGRDGCPQPSVRGRRCGCRSGQRRARRAPPYLNCPLRPSCPQVLVYAPCPHVTVPTSPLEGSAFAGRDGCPQPSVRGWGCAPRERSYSRSGQRRVGDNPPYPRHRGGRALPLINLPRPQFPLRIGFTTVRFSLLGPEFHPSGPAVKWPAEKVSSVRRNT